MKTTSPAGRTVEVENLSYDVDAVSRAASVNGFTRLIIDESVILNSLSELLEMDGPAAADIFAALNAMAQQDEDDRRETEAGYSKARFY